MFESWVWLCIIEMQEVVKKMNYENKAIGSISIIIGLAVWYVDYIIFTAIGALTVWIAEMAGATGGAAFGIQIIGWLLTAGIMLAILVSGGMFMIQGLHFIIED